jgi:polyhydroxyalkanoate synthesis regulator phasin
MVRDAVRGYLALASGLTEVTAARAKAAARALVEQGEATATQVSSLAEDLVSTSRRNRESVAVLVKHEVEQAVRRVGLAPSLQLDDLTRRVRDLERTIRELAAAATKPADPDSAQRRPEKASATKPAKRITAKKSPAKPPTNSPAKQPAAKKTAAKKTAAKKAPATTAAKKPAQRTSSKKAAPRKAASKKTAAKKTAASKSTAARRAKPGKRGATPRKARS